MKAEITFEKGIATTNQALSKNTVEILLGNVYKGDKGESAYEIAVANGFEGTEDEWLASLHVATDSELNPSSDNAIANKAVAKKFSEVESNTGVSEYEDFSNAKAYSVGDIVKYNGLLYEFTADHEAGEWNSEEVTKTSLKKDIESNINRIDTDIDIYSDILQNTTNIFVFEKKYVSLNGEKKATFLNLNCTDYLPISAFKDVLVYAYNYNSGDARLATFFDNNKAFLGASANGDNTYKEFSIEELAEGFEGAEYVRLSVRFDHDYGIYTTWKKQINTDIEGINTDIEGINTDIEGINTDIEGINTDIDNSRKADAVLLGRKLTSTNLIAEQTPIFLKNRYYSPAAGDFINREGYSCHVWIEVEPNTDYYGIGQAFEFDENKEYLNLFNGLASMTSTFHFVTSENCRYLVLSYANTPQFIQPGTENTNGYWVSELNGTQKNSITDEYLDIENHIEKSSIIQNIQKNDDLIFKGCKMVQSRGDVIDFSEVTIVANAEIKDANSKMFSEKAKLCCGIKSETDSYIKLPVTISSWDSLTFVMYCPYDTCILTTGTNSGYLRIYLNNQGQGGYGTWFNGRWHAGWNFLTITKDEIAQNIDSISNIYIKLEARDTVSIGNKFANIILDSIIVDLKTKPTILINFDQLWHESIDNGGYKKLYDNNIPATFFSKNYADMDEEDITYIKDFSNMYGWELASYSNVGSGNGIIERATSYATAKESCDATIADFVDTFNCNVVSFAATQAQCNEIGVNAILNSGYIGIRYGANHPMTYFNKETGGWIQHNDVAAMTLQEHKDMLDKCIKYGLVWGWFTHGICADGETYMLTNDTQERGMSNGVQLSIFNSFIDYLKSKIDEGAIQAITFKEFYRQCGIEVK